MTNEQKQVKRLGGFPLPVSVYSLFLPKVAHATTSNIKRRNKHMKTIDGVLEIQNKMVIRGKTIKLLRIIKDTTLKQMEEETGISISVLSAMENEIRSVSSVNQLKVTNYLIKELGYSPDEIVVIQSFVEYKGGFKDGKGQS
jgi:hypothetical protein